MIKGRIFLIAFFLVAILTASAQVKSITLKHFTGEDGLSDNQVTCILRDKLGFMWIGTRDGLNRFDGREFYVFKHNENDSQSIGGNNIKCLELDADSLLWIGTEGNGFCSYNFRTGKFKTYNRENSPLNSNQVNDIAFDRSENILWLGLNNSGLQIYDLERKSIRKKSAMVSTNTYYDIELKDSIAYFAGIVESLKRIENIGKFRTQIPDYARCINKIIAASDGKLWCGAWDNGLHEFDTETKLLNSFCFDGSTRLKSSGDEIISIAEDANGILWCGTKTSAVHFFDLKKRSFTDEIKFSQPLTTRINSIYRDNFNRMWLATEGGLYCYDPLLNQFETTVLPVPNSNISCKVNDRIITRGGKEFVITNCGLFYKSESDASYTYKEIICRNEKQELTSMFSDSEVGIFVGTNRSVFMLDTIKTELKIVPVNPVAQYERMYYVGGSRVNTISEIKHREKNYIVACYYGLHISLIDLEKKNRFMLMRDTAIKDIFIDNLCRKILIDSKNNFWFCGLTFGVTKLRIPDDLSLTNLPFEDTTYHELIVDIMHWAKAGTGKLKVNNAFDMIESQDGTYWVTTQGNGLVKFNPDNESEPFVSYANNFKSLQGVAKVGEENLWMISSKGLLNYNIKTKRYKLFDTKSGVTQNIGGYFFYNSLTNKSKLLSVGFDGGFISFVPDNILRDTERPLVTVSKIWVLNAVSDSLLISDIKLRYDQNFIKFYLSSNCFTNNEQVTYLYRLSGIDKEWRSNENNPLIAYTNLPPGSFSFEYKAVNSDGVESDIKTLSLVIVPPFYQTWYFYLLATVFLLALVYTIYRIRLNQILKLQDVRNKIARDLHDDIGSTLGSISLYSQIANVKLQQKKTEEIGVILNKIGISSREIIDKTGDAVWAVKASNDTLKNLVLRMESYAALLLGSASINFTIDYNERDVGMKLEMIQRKNIFLIFKESIHNIIKYAHCTEVSIHIKRIGGKIQIQIKDNGKGFNPLSPESYQDDNYRDREGQREIYNGNGIKNMKTRAEEIGGSFLITSEREKGTLIIIMV